MKAAIWCLNRSLDSLVFSTQFGFREIAKKARIIICIQTNWTSGLYRFSILIPIFKLPYVRKINIFRGIVDMYMPYQIWFNLFRKVKLTDHSQFQYLPFQKLLEYVFIILRSIFLNKQNCSDFYIHLISANLSTFSQVSLQHLDF